MAPPSSRSDVHFGRLSKSGHGYVIHVPRAVRVALGWSHQVVVELWIEGDTLHVHRALAARDALRADTAPAADSPAGPGGKVGP